MFSRLILSALVCSVLFFSVTKLWKHRRVHTVSRTHVCVCTHSHRDTQNVCHQVRIRYYNIIFLVFIPPTWSTLKIRERTRSGLPLSTRPDCLPRQGTRLDPWSREDRQGEGDSYWEWTYRPRLRWEPRRVSSLYLSFTFRSRQEKFPALV